MGTQLYIKMIVELPHAFTTCVVATVHFSPISFLTFSDDQAMFLLDKVAQTTVHRIPDAVRLLSAEYISEQEAADISQYHKEKEMPDDDSDHPDENEETGA